MRPTSSVLLDFWLRFTPMNFGYSSGQKRHSNLGLSLSLAVGCNGCCQLTSRWVKEEQRTWRLYVDRVCNGAETCYIGWHENKRPTFVSYLIPSNPFASHVAYRQDRTYIRIYEKFTNTGTNLGTKLCFQKISLRKFAGISGRSRWNDKRTFSERKGFDICTRVCKRRNNWLYFHIIVFHL